MNLKKSNFIHIFAAIFLFISLLCMTTPNANAEQNNTSSSASAVPDVENIVGNTATGYINEQNAALHDELRQMLQDETNKAQLQEYINATRPVVDKYQGYFNTALDYSLAAERHIPVIGHLIGSLIITTTNYFYEKELTELAQSDVAQKFAQLRNANLDLDVNLFQKAITYYIDNKQIDLKLIEALQHEANEKLENARFIQDIVTTSGIEFQIKDIGTVIPKLSK